MNICENRALRARPNQCLSDNCSTRKRVARKSFFGKLRCSTVLVSVAGRMVALRGNRWWQLLNGSLCFQFLWKCGLEMLRERKCLKLNWYKWALMKEWKQWAKTFSTATTGSHVIGWEEVEMFLRNVKVQHLSPLDSAYDYACSANFSVTIEMDLETKKKSLWEGRLLGQRAWMLGLRLLWHSWQKKKWEGSISKS